MSAPDFDEKTYRRLPSRYRSKDLLYTRAAQVFHARLKSPLFLSSSIFERTLCKILTATSERDFDLPVSYAIVALGEKLHVTFPTKQLATGLRDWISNGEHVIHTNSYFIGGGKWDAIIYRLSSLPVFREAQELYECDMRFRETASYRRYHIRMQQNDPIRRQHVLMSSTEQVDAYFEKFVTLFESIRENGLLKQFEWGGVEKYPWPVSTFSRWRAGQLENDIGLAIDADGRIHKLPGGQHRTAIATVLGLPSIPVQVRLVHREWLRKISSEDVPLSEALTHAIAAIASPVSQNEIFSTRLVPPRYGAAIRVKRQLSYRLGAIMIEYSRSAWGWIRMPWALLIEIRRYRHEKSLRKTKLPPVSSYCDAEEAEKVKRHLSYRLGKTAVDLGGSFSGWIKMPFALYREVKLFRRERSDQKE